MTEVLLSAAMIVHDEERHLDACLASLHGVVDEIVVVDTGSTDATTTIAARHGARVADFPWQDDFAAARNRSLELARGRWILYVDADERVRPADGRALRRLLRDPRYVGLWVTFHWRPGYTPYREMRLFRNDPRIRFEGVIHENMWPGILRLMDERGLLIGQSPLALDHVGYEGDLRGKHRRNLPLLLRSVEATPGKVYNWCHLAATYAGLDRPRDAERAWRRALLIVRSRPSPDLNDSLAFTEYVAWRRGRGESIDRLLAEGRDRFPENHQLRWLHGRRLVERKRFAQAIPMFEELLSHRHGSGLDDTVAYDRTIFGVGALDSLATCHFRLGNHGESARYYALALAEEPGSFQYEVKRQLAARLAARSPDPAGAALTETTARAESERFIRQLPPYPGGFRGRGVVICAGGLRYFANAWVCIRMLRRAGCRLPVQLWHLGELEMTPAMKAAIAPLGVECVDAFEVRKRHPARRLGGWELKPYAILHCPFEEVILLDADIVPLIDPETLLDTPEYRRTGALFWPDIGRLAPDASIWTLCGVEYRDEPEVESGQIVVDKARCWAPLRLALWYCGHSDFFWRHVNGDKETLHLAFRTLGHAYAMPERGVHVLPSPVHTMPGVLCQHGFDGRRIFQHRVGVKWSYDGDNPRIPGFEREDECLEHLAELRRLWSPGWVAARKPARLRRIAASLIGRRWDLVCAGFDRRTITLDPDGRVGEGRSPVAAWWDLGEVEGKVRLDVMGSGELTCQLARAGRAWRGRGGRMSAPVSYELRPARGSSKGAPAVRPVTRARAGSRGAASPSSGARGRAP